MMSDNIRRRARQADVAGVRVGGAAPIAAQSVTPEGDRVAGDFQALVESYVRATSGGEAAAPELWPAKKTIAVKAVA